MVLRSTEGVIIMTALASPKRRIPVRAASSVDLRDKRDRILDQVGSATWEELFDKIELGEYSEKERIAYERIASINWLLGSE